MPIRSRRFAGLIAAFAVLATIGVVVWVIVLVWNQASPIEPTPVATPSASPGATPIPTGIATPVPTRSVVPTAVPGSLPDLLRYAPDRLADNSLPLSDIARYANIEGWMTARGVSTPATLPRIGDPWERELDALAMPDVMHARANDPIWRETYGFNLVDVDQMLAVGEAPDFVMILRGDFDADTLHAAWVQSGYQAVRTHDFTIWSLFPGDTVDLSAPASRPALGNMNNLILLDDGTLIAASRLSRLEETLRVVRGEASSLAQNPSIAALLAPGANADDLVSAVIMKGSILAADLSTPVTMSPPDAMMIASPLAPMPIADLVLAGIAAPETPDARPIMSLIVSYGSVDDATYAMVRVNDALSRDDSPVTGEPYTERLRLIGMRVVSANTGAVLLVQTRPVLGVDDWLVMVADRDFGFLAWPYDAGS